LAARGPPVIICAMTTNGEMVGKRPVRYAPRSLSTLAPERFGAWTVKRYAVSALRPVPPAEVEEFARRAVALTLPEAHSGAPSHAFSVVHEDEDGCYAVVGWWSQNRLIVHTRTWLGDWAELIPAEAPGNATACIWELVAIAHERDAWVRHVVQPDCPDIPAYLASAVSGQF